MYCLCEVAFAPIAGVNRVRWRLLEKICIVSMGVKKQTALPPLLELERAKTQAPPMYKVFLLNDDFTPMDFVVIVLQEIFFMDRDLAIRVMLAIHQYGRSVCGVYNKDLAETKVHQVMQYAKQHEHPLQCVMEEN